MRIIPHIVANTKIAEIDSGSVTISSVEDSLDVLGSIYYQGFDKLIIHESNLTADFFELKNGLAGEILQKFSNYRMQLAIVGDFGKYTKKSIRDFIHESNRMGFINFVSSISEALQKLAPVR